VNVIAPAAIEQKPTARATINQVADAGGQSVAAHAMQPNTTAAPK
jgi:hypothetical protein